MALPYGIQPSHRTISLVWAVEKLQNLLLPKIRFISGWDDPLDPGFEKLQNLAARKPRCTSLETLVLDFTHFNSPSFPFRFVFGTSATRIGLLRRINRFEALDGELDLSYTRYVSGLASLQEIVLVVNSDGQRRDVPAAIAWFRDCVLRRLQPRSDSFWRIGVEMFLCDNVAETFAQGFFDSRQRLDDAFNTIPNLRNVSFRLQFGDGPRDDIDVEARLEDPCSPHQCMENRSLRRSWFDQRIRDALPRLRAKLSVNIGDRLSWPKLQVGPCVPKGTSDGLTSEPGTTVDDAQATESWMIVPWDR
ncbi:hypothetical protein ACG7TL_009148 [Trametes sanguinea]